MGTPRVPGRFFIWENSDAFYESNDGYGEQLASLRGIPRCDVDWLSTEMPEDLGEYFEANFKRAVKSSMMRTLKKSYDEAIPGKFDIGYWCKLELPQSDFDAIMKKLKKAGYDVGAFSWTIYLGTYLSLRRKEEEEEEEEEVESGVSFRVRSFSARHVA